jgi:serine protease Do
MKKINIRYLVISLILVLVLTLGAGCSLVPGLGTAPQTSSPATEIPSNPSENITPIDAGWSISPPQSQAPILPSIADVVAKVKPSVVAINTKVTSYIFNRPVTEEGAGSGWIISENGIIVTNSHVVEGANDITVVLDDGRTFAADLKAVFTDPLADLAVVKIDAKNLPTVTVGDSAKLRVGDWVVAIGNSLGQGTTAKEGIISRLGVTMDVDSDETLYGLLETSAAINPGNSGGPLVNMAGEVIGITSAKIAATGVEGMGYAISSQEVVPILEQLINKGYVVRPWLGVELYTVDQFVVFRYDLAVDQGAFLVSVTAGSPADKAGLKAGDVITKFGDQEITTVSELTRALNSSNIGQEVKITLWRNRGKNTVYVTLVESPPPS